MAWERIGCMARKYQGPGGRVEIPPEITVIAPGTFLGSRGVTEIVLHRQVLVVQEGAFSGCTDLERFLVEPGNGTYTAKGPLLLDEEGHRLLSAPSASGAAVLPEEITRLAKEAFRGCRKLRSVALPSSLRVLPDRCFQDCVGLREMTLPETVEEIGREAFRGCRRLRKLRLPRGKPCGSGSGPLRTAPPSGRLSSLLEPG